MVAWQLRVVTRVGGSSNVKMGDAALSCFVELLWCGLLREMYARWRDQ